MGNGNLWYTVSQDQATGRHTVRWETYTSFNMPREIRLGHLADTTNPTAAVAERTLSFAYGPEHQPGKYSVGKGLRLISGTDSPHAKPVFSMDLPVPNGMSMQELVTNLVAAAKTYQNDLPYNFPLMGVGTMMWGYNSNSYVSGVLMRATGQYQSIVESTARSAGFLTPGFSKPMPIGSE